MKTVNESDLIESLKELPQEKSWIVGSGESLMHLAQLRDNMQRAGLRPVMVCERSVLEVVIGNGKSPLQVITFASVLKTIQERSFGGMLLKVA